MLDPIIRRYNLEATSHVSQNIFIIQKPQAKYHKTYFGIYSVHCVIAYGNRDEFLLGLSFPA